MYTALSMYSNAPILLNDGTCVPCYKRYPVYSHGQTQESKSEVNNERLRSLVVVKAKVQTQVSSTRNTLTQQTNRRGEHTV